MMLGIGLCGELCAYLVRLRSYRPRQDGTEWSGKWGGGRSRLCSMLNNSYDRRYRRVSQRSKSGKQNTRLAVERNGGLGFGTAIGRSASPTCLEEGSGVLPRIKELAGGNAFPMQHLTATDVYAELHASVLIGAANRTVLILVTCTCDRDFILGCHGHRMCIGLMSRVHFCQVLTAHSPASPRKFTGPLKSLSDLQARYSSGL
ncbi:hypothetical protein FB567DRAFT_189623 [Paraphoma chrysanthemicola]|uniref:Uncharacterized protein n=1 Tax=Paraphoma chrysanthemicola TaxID=798071 RepID=A0A8K0QX40_9PLEO|nr:hypothetical protein FB567DRAFT_189623 [Paraphoma chrysanthemicola]